MKKANLSIQHALMFTTLLKDTYVFMKLDPEKKGIAISGKVCESLHHIGSSLYICIVFGLKFNAEKFMRKRFLNMKSMLN